MNKVYSSTKIFKYREKIESLTKESEIQPPLHIRIKPINHCSHNCWYCSYRSKGLQIGKDMNLNDFIPKKKMFEIIDDLNKMKVSAITFSGGGEPLEYPYIQETLEKLIQTKIQFATLTNGSHLQGEVAKLLAHNATWVRISIDGWDATSYARYRQCSLNEYSKVHSNISTFAQMKTKSRLGISIIADHKNAPHLYEMIKKYSSLGVDNVKISGVVISDSKEKNNDYYKKIFKSTKSEIQRAQEDFTNSSFEIYDSFHYAQDDYSKNYSWCPYIQIKPIIGADLNIYSCQDKAYNHETGIIGSIKDKSFKDFWFSSKKSMLKINPKCDCQHHCVSDSGNRLIHDYLSLDNNHIAFV
jgi:wyosine [tRNA(Phe)-imidazoG37] synthetase (radical SAM superfamily)